MPGRIWPGVGGHPPNGGSAEDQSVVAKIQKMGCIAIAVVDEAGAFPAIRLAGQLARCLN